MQVFPCHLLGIWVKICLRIAIFTSQIIRLPPSPLSFYCKDRKFLPNFDSVPKSLQSWFCQDLLKWSDTHDSVDADDWSVKIPWSIYSLYALNMYLFLQGLEYDSKCVLTLNLKGLAVHNAGFIDRACDIYRQAFKLDPCEYWLHYNYHLLLLLKKSTPIWTYSLT